MSYGCYGWCELDYRLQQRVMRAMHKLIAEEEDTDIQDGIVAAIVELEMWSNDPERPLSIVDEDEIVAQATDPSDDPLN